MADIKIDNSRIPKIINREPNLNLDDDADDLVDSSSTFHPSLQMNPKIEEEDKVDKYINYRYSKKTLERTPQIKDPKKSIGLPISGIFIFILVVAAIYFGSIYFEKATVIIDAKEQSSTLSDKQFVAAKNIDSDLGFEIMIMSGEETKSMTLTETENVSIKSSGEVTLFNEFSTASQNLLVGTFLSDNDGKTYRLNNNVKIPGYTVDSDKKIIPGSIDVPITAFLPGDAYNGSTTDFHIVGFKGTAKYTKIYAKAKTSLSGGRTGVVYVLSENEKAGINSATDTVIKNDLQKKLQAEVPDGYIYYPGSITYSYNLGDGNYYDQPKAEVKIAYNLSVVLLKKDDLSNAIIKNLLPKITPAELKQITITDLSKLTFAFVDKNQFVNKELESVIFSLTGQVDLVWKPNTEEIKNKIVGLAKDNIKAIFDSETGISSANLKMMPPWKSSLPTDPHRISVVVR